MKKISVDIVKVSHIHCFSEQHRNIFVVGDTEYDNKYVLVKNPDYSNENNLLEKLMEFPPKDPALQDQRLFYDYLFHNACGVDDWNTFAAGKFIYDTYRNYTGTPDKYFNKLLEEARSKNDNAESIDDKVNYLASCAPDTFVNLVLKAYFNDNRFTNKNLKSNVFKDAEDICARVISSWCIDDNTPPIDMPYIATVISYTEFEDNEDIQYIKKRFRYATPEEKLEKLKALNGKYYNDFIQNVTLAKTIYDSYNAMYPYKPDNTQISLEEKK